MNDSSVSSPPASKPLLRGWFHPFAAAASMDVTLILLERTAGDHPRFCSLLVFGAAMVLLFTISSVYHIGNWSPRVRRFWRTFDHSNIYVVIAGAAIREGEWLFSLWLLLGGLVAAVGSRPRSCRRRCCSAASSACAARS